MSQSLSISAQKHAETQQRLFAGVDVGGTNIKIGIVDDNGNVLAKTQFATQQHLGPLDAMGRAAATIKRLLAENSIGFDKLNAVGLGTPGPIDVPTGMICDPSNLPAWHNFLIKNSLSEQVGLPVSFCNDANAAAMGEFWIGGGQTCQSLVLLTLGTGVGGGIVINNLLIEGTNSLAGECGHVLIDTSKAARMCGCGRKGHLEAYASATAVVQRYVEQVDPSKLNCQPTAKSIADLAASGDVLAKQIVMETADYLGRAIGIFAHTIDPEVVILGGAMNFGGAEAALGQQFLGRILESVKAQTFSQISARLKIKFASLGGDAGWIGAAAIARKKYNVNQ